MRQWLKKNWSDPVWSRVIAWAIYTPIGLAAGTVLLWSQSHFSFNFDIAWAAAVSSLRTIWRWLDNPSNLPQGGLWWTLIASATLIAWMIRQHRRDAETKNKITPHQLDEPTTRRAPARFQQLPPVSSLDSASAQALIALASAYPGGTERERLISHMGVGFMVGEQVLEGWAGLRLIEYRRAAAIRRWI